MPASPHRQRIILGSGPVASVLAQVFDALPIPDERLIRQKWGLSTPFESPLIGCRHVFQVATATESSAQTRWRHDAFWRLYGAKGGRDIKSDPGLKWLLLDCHHGDRGCGATPSPYCLPVSVEVGLFSILEACNEARPHQFTEWLNSQLTDEQVALRKEILQLVCKGEHTEENRSRILKLASNLLPLRWERYCPLADHELANRIREWLLAPDTDPVTQWFVEGESLLRQIILTP
ncbi:MAG: hypothetical protein EAZ42_01585 [Verrucomicrobia bacterium]|nr:MAG: hypothetical protein EAZ42_01585 [Verrucomicrobiota bacterium]